MQLDSREDKIRELKIHVETSRENEAKQIAMAQSLRQKVIEYEAQYGSLEGAANRSEHAINTLQRDNKEQQERILELESRIRCIDISWFSSNMMMWAEYRHCMHYWLYANLLLWNNAVIKVL